MINHGLPQYVAIDRKPENGCEIQNAACGRSGVMLRLKLVKGVNLPGSEDEVFGSNEESLLHGTNVLKHVVSPWFGSNRIVCADSYFASVGAAKELFCNGLRFIGVVKTATRGYPKTFLTSVELHNRGDFLALRSNATENSLEPGAMCGWIGSVGTLFPPQGLLKQELHTNDADGEASRRDSECASRTSDDHNRSIEDSGNLLHYLWSD